MEINGKVYRNLEGQVGYLTEKWDDLQDQINDIRSHLTHYVIVEELPTEDIDTSAIYLVGPLGTDPDTYYEEWVYVQLEDESWTWEKLGDTDSVDLSGYLEKVTTATTYDQVYAKSYVGGQSMIDIGQNNAIANSIVRRTSTGQVITANPTTNEHAANKKYVDDNFVTKRTDVTQYPICYAKAADGSVDNYNITTARIAYAIPLRDANAEVWVPNSPQDSATAINTTYADGRYLAKQTGTSSYVNVYAKTTDGSQVMLNVDGNPISHSIPFRFAYGHIKLPNQLTYPPTDDDYAVSKRYVDALVGQLLYLHRIQLTFAAVSGTDDLTVFAYLINDDPTAITTLTSEQYCRMNVAYGALGSTGVSVTKCPNDFVYGNLDVPRHNGLLYQYLSGGSLVSAAVNSNNYTMTVTDVVQSF